MIRFEDIYETVRRHHPGADLELLRKAYIFSAVEHKGQTRASGEPYLVHPLEVANILAEMRMDPACVAVGLLHDVLEDTLTDADRIKEYFGEDVLHIVEGVTKISKIPFSTSEERQAENFRKLLLAMVDDIRVILVKLADRLHNMRTLQHLPGGAPGAHRRRDHGHLRAPGRPAGHEQDQERARGPGLPVPGARGLQGAHPPGGGEAQEGHRVHREGEGHGVRAAAGRRPRRHPRGAHQAPVLHPPEAAPAAHRPRPGLRLRGPAHRGAHHPRLLRRPRRAAQPLAAGAGAHQGLHRHAAAQRLPVAAHLGDRGRGPSLRGADPHPRDAPHRRGGDRRPLEVQGGAHRLQQGRPGLRLAAPAPGVAAGGEGPARVPELAEARPLPRGGLLLHARGRGEDAAPGGDAGGLRLRHPHRGRPPVRGRAGERQDGPPALQAEERRHRRDPHRRRPPPQPRLADLHRHQQGPGQDPPLPEHRGEAAGGGDRQEALRARAEALRPRA